MESHGVGSPEVRKSIEVRKSVVFRIVTTHRSNLFLFYNLAFYTAPHSVATAKQCVMSRPILLRAVLLAVLGIPCLGWRNFGVKKIAALSSLVWGMSMPAALEVLAVESPTIYLAVDPGGVSSNDAINGVQRTRAALQQFLAFDGTSPRTLQEIQALSKSIDKVELKSNILKGLTKIEKTENKEYRNTVLYHGKTALEDIELVEEYGLPEKEQIEFSTRALNAASKELGLYMLGLEGSAK